jgi:hypothetical protein
MPGADDVDSRMFLRRLNELTVARLLDLLNRFVIILSIP